MHRRSVLQKMFGEGKSAIEGAKSRQAGTNCPTNHLDSMLKLGSEWTKTGKCIAATPKTHISAKAAQDRTARPPRAAIVS